MDDKTPLLTNGKLNGKSWNSINTLRCDFLSRLPEKLKTSLDPETLLHLDVSKTSGLTQGKPRPTSKFDQDFLVPLVQDVCRD